jgi:DNA-binding MarR family transcriptional regulator
MTTPSHLSLLLERANRVVGDHLIRSIGLEGITPDHFRVLRHLADELGHPMGEIAERLEMNPPTLTKLIDRMVGKSLVQRAADPEDSRRVLVYATDGGLDLLEELQGKVDEHHAALRALLGDRNARQLERLLTTLIEAAERPAA